jgi:hypothetical protein
MPSNESPHPGSARRIATLVFFLIKIVVRKFAKRKDAGTIIPIFLVLYLVAIGRFAAVPGKEIPSTAKLALLAVCGPILACIAFSRLGAHSELRRFSSAHSVSALETRLAEASFKSLAASMTAILALPMAIPAGLRRETLMLTLAAYCLSFAAAFMRPYRIPGRDLRFPDQPLPAIIARLACGGYWRAVSYASLGLALLLLTLAGDPLRPLLMAKSDIIFGAMFLADACIALDISLDDTLAQRSNFIRAFPRSWSWWMLKSYESSACLLAVPRALMCAELVLLGRNPAPFACVCLGSMMLFPAFYEPTFAQTMVFMGGFSMAAVFIMNGYYASYILIAAAAAVSIAMARRDFLGMAFNGRSLEQLRRLR